VPANEPRVPISRAAPAAGSRRMRHQPPNQPVVRAEPPDQPAACAVPANEPRVPISRAAPAAGSRRTRPETNENRRLAPCRLMSRAFPSAEPRQRPVLGECGINRPINPPFAPIRPINRRPVPFVPHSCQALSAVAGQVRRDVRPHSHASPPVQVEHAQSLR
jgi:hypothetical protein